MELNDILKANEKYLDKKKPQTTYKIRYVTSYVDLWLRVVCNVKENRKINFIDCMCNAGIYKDGDLGTGIQVLKLFNIFAQNYPDKQFNLVLNDIDNNRVQIIREVADIIINKKLKNINILYQNRDVNDFLSNDDFFGKLFNCCYPYRSANLVFADPYNFTAVSITVLQRFLQKYYCELIYNLFTNDYVRNNDKEKVSVYCKKENIDLENKDGILEIIRQRLKVGKIKYSFSYEFKTSTNAELYEIMYFTPSAKGLEKLKEALWNTFNGREFYKNKTENEIGQMSFLSDENEKSLMLEYHASIARTVLLQCFEGQEIEYSQIEMLLLEKTLLNSNQIIDHVLKPLLAMCKITKTGKAPNRNFKQDSYRVIK